MAVHGCVSEPDERWLHTSNTQSRCSSEHRRWQQTWHSRSLNTNTNLEIALRDNELMDLSTIPQKMETPRQPTASPWLSCIAWVERRPSIKWHQ